LIGVIWEYSVLCLLFEQTHIINNHSLLQNSTFLLKKTKKRSWFKGFQHHLFRRKMVIKISFIALFKRRAFFQLSQGDDEWEWG
jgi:hypothetical protein